MSVTNGTIGLVRETDIIEEMQGAYLDYAMSVIVSRALPDVRDGLKPVHRRILYAISHDLGLDHTKPHKKSARIVGEVLGKYHPHGDTAVYDAMVRMAQEFSLRYPLVDGQGNFGSVDGDNAAAMRYTEACLAEISQLMLTDLEKDTVDWHDNFDNSLSEPDILPASLPNLLINGASGIAVGMATNVPPHNLGEVVDALAFMIDRYDQLDEVTVEDLMQFVQGPDFPTGGILYRFREEKGDEADAIAQGYSVGKARLIMQAKAHFEEMSRSRSRIVITELPYQTNKMALLERIAYLVRDGKIEGITDLRDESDRTGMRVVLELTRTVEPKDVLADLFKKTPLQQTFGMQMLALVDGEPRLLSLKRILHLFIQHRQEILSRRSEYELRRARERAHIVEGLLRALDMLDDVIDTIRRSQNVDTARKNLMRKFSFTQVQAQAILDMQLRRLAALERRKLQDEFKELQKQIAYLEDLLANPTKMLAVIKQDLLAMKEKYGDVRRTQIVDRTKGTLTSTDLLPQQDVWVSVGANGDLRRQDVVKLSVSVLQRVGKGSEVEVLTANTRDYLYLFCKDGRSSRVAIHEIPYNGNNMHVAELTEFTRRDDITAAISLPRISPEEAAGYLFLVTERGMVKRIPLADFLSLAASDPRVINVDDKDRLRWVLPTVGEQEMMLVSASGQAIRFSEEDVRSMGLAAGGVGGMRLKKGDQVVQAMVVEPQGELVTLTQYGYAKRTSLEQYSSQGRNGGGIVTHKPNAQTGKVAAALLLDGNSPDALVVVPSKGAVMIVEVAKIPLMGRGVQGKRVVDTSDTKPVVAMKAATEPSASTMAVDSESTVSIELPVNGTQSAHDGSTNGNLPKGSRSRTTSQSATADEVKSTAANTSANVSGKKAQEKEKAEADGHVSLFEATAPANKVKPAAGKRAKSQSATTPSKSKPKSKSGSTPPAALTTGSEGKPKSKPKAAAESAGESAAAKPAVESKNSRQKKKTATETKTGSASRSTTGGQDQPEPKKTKAKTTTQEASKASAKPVQDGSEHVAQNSNGKRETSRRTVEPTTSSAAHTASDKKPDKTKTTGRSAPSSPAPVKGRRTTKVAAVTTVKTGQTKKKG